MIQPDDLVRQVADEIERLNSRPNSTGRCLLALDRYLETRSNKDRRKLADAYLAIPATNRRYALGDMDAKDRPLRVLCTPVGDRLIGESDQRSREPVVTEDMQQSAFEYFTERRQSQQVNAASLEPDDPISLTVGPIFLDEVALPNGWSDRPDLAVLRNEYLAEIEFGGVFYPTVTNAYWSLSTDDREAAERIRMSERPHDGKKLAAQATRRTGWPEMKTGVMAALLRAKFAQHPNLADTLLTTGEAPIYYSGAGSNYWHINGEKGRNWIGRLLELIRSELLAERAGLTH